MSDVGADVVNAVPTVALVQGAAVSHRLGAVVVSVVESLAAKLGRGPTAAEFLEAAIQHDELKDQFEHDDAAAAHEYRLSQARKLLGSVKISWKNEGVEYSSPRFVAVKSAEGTQYVPTEQALATALDQMRATALQSLRHWYLRHGALASKDPELKELVDFLRARWPLVCEAPKIR